MNSLLTYWQDLLAYLIVGLAAAWLLLRAFRPAPARTASCASSGCGQCDGCDSGTSLPASADVSLDLAVPVQLLDRHPS